MVYGYAKSILPLLGFLCWNIPPKKKEYWAMYCTPSCGFIKKYNMVGMAMSWLQSCWERRIFCHKLATILPRYSILVPRHVAAKVVNKKYSKYWAYIMAREYCFLPVLGVTSDSLINISQSFFVNKDGLKFWWLPWFPAKNHSPQTFQLAM